jgi:hypothetical protein
VNKLNMTPLDRETLTTEQLALEEKIKMEIDRKIREISKPPTAAEAAALTTPEPNKMEEELAGNLVVEIYGRAEACFSFSDFANYISPLIQSALDAYAKAKVEEAVEEAAGRLCNECDNFVNTTTGEHPTTCTRDPKSCELLAAILGKEGESNEK